MADFTVTITDEHQLAGITAARAAYNSSLPETIPDEDGNEIPNPAILNTDADYVQFVMSKAAESYANQYNT
jgi:hypothetical protein